MSYSEIDKLEVYFVKYDYPKALVELRAKLNISQHELADLFGVSYPSVSRWENGHFEPTKIVKFKVDNLLKDNNIILDEVEE